MSNGSSYYKFPLSSVQVVVMFPRRSLLVYDDSFFRLYCSDFDCHSYMFISVLHGLRL